MMRFLVCGTEMHLFPPSGGIGSYSRTEKSNYLLLRIVLLWYCTDLFRQRKEIVSTFSRNIDAFFRMFTSERILLEIPPGLVENSLTQRSLWRDQERQPLPYKNGDSGP